MTIPLQFASLYDGQEAFVWSDCLLDLGTDFLAGNMVFVWDVQYLAVVSHFHGLYSSLELFFGEKQKKKTKKKNASTSSFKLSFFFAVRVLESLRVIPQRHKIV